MKQRFIALFLFFLSSLPIYSKARQPEVLPAALVHVDHHENANQSTNDLYEDDFIGELLQEALERGLEQEPLKIEPIPLWQRMLRRVGNTVVWFYAKTIALHKYVKTKWLSSECKT